MQHEDGRPLKPGTMCLCNTCGAVLIFDPEIEGGLRDLTFEGRTCPTLYRSPTRQGCVLGANLAPKTREGAGMNPLFKLLVGVLVGVVAYALSYKAAAAWAMQWDSFFPRDSNWLYFVVVVIPLLLGLRLFFWALDKVDERVNKSDGE